MAAPVTGTVRFNVNVRTRERDGHWAALCRETGVLTYGATRDAAETLNGEANVSVVRHIKSLGADRLKNYMDGKGILFSVDDDSDFADKVTALPLAA